LPPQVTIESEVPSTFSDSRPARTCNYTIDAASNITDCNELAFTATHSSGVTAVVSAGGDYDPNDGYAVGSSCFICCKGADEVPEEIEVSWENNDSVLQSGTYVLELIRVRNVNPFFNESTSDRRVWFGFNISVVLHSCSLLVPIAADLNASFFQPLGLTDEECDDCHKKCFTYGEFAGVASEGRACSQCAETPICEPSGSFVIDNFVGLRGTVTVL
jgi:hypothetical protein